MVPKHLEHYVRLSVEARSDIEWWFQYAQIWNGVSMMHLPNAAVPAAVLTSDASGKWGCGAYSGANWFMLTWSDLTAGHHITVKELVPIVLAGAMCGPLWQGTTMFARCDNMAVVNIANHGTSRNQDAMHLARCLAFITARFEFHIVAVHIKGTLVLQ